VVWIAPAAAWFAGMAVAIKIAGQTVTPWQIVMPRSLMTLTVVLPMLLRQGLSNALTRKPLMHTLCVRLGFCSITTWCSA